MKSANQQINEQFRKKLRKPFRRSASPSAPDQRDAPRTRPSYRKWLILSLGLILAFGGAWACFELVIWARVPPELIGQWVVREGPDTGSTIEFSRNGTMVTRIKNPGLQGVYEIEAQVRVRGKQIQCTFTNHDTGEKGTRVQVIRSLDATHLVLQDEQGRAVKLERE